MAVVKIVKATTPAHMAAARTLIEEYGYYHNPLAGAHYLALEIVQPPEALTETERTPL